MGSSTEWEVNRFTVKTGTRDGTSDVLYANGRMRVPVYVDIVANVKGETNRYNLTTAELNTIQLIDYDAPGNTLSNGWAVDGQGGDYGISLNAASPKASLQQISAASFTSLEQEADNSGSSDNGTPQCKQFWVSTTKIENKNVGARVKQSDGTVVTTHSTDFDSHVTLTGKEPITYTYPDNITVTREDTASGDYDYEWQNALTGNWDTAKKHWDQDNYYISTNTHTLKKADIHDYKGDNSHLSHCYAYCVREKTNLDLFFIWDYGKEATKTAGLYKEATVVDWGTDCGRKAHAEKDIKVNQKENALCLTRLAYDCSDTIWGSSWWFNCGFTLYDIYGNKGTFSAGFSDDRNKVVIKNSNK